MIYLDTSTVSHIARALYRQDLHSPWIFLYESLKKAVGLEAICCPGSSTVRTEAELCRYSKEIIDLSRSLSDPGLKHQLQIRHSQIFRALDRFLEEKEPLLEKELNPEDAFNENINKWLSTYKIHIDVDGLIIFSAYIEKN